MLFQEWNWDDALRVREEEGYAKGKKSLVLAILDDFSDEVIAQKANLPIEEVKSIREQRDGYKNQKKTQT